MNERVATVAKSVLFFLLVVVGCFAIQYILESHQWLAMDYRIHLLLAVMSLIVVLTVSAVYWAGHQQKIGFAFLGFVVFKMFGIGYLTVFQPEFRKHIILYFIVFWFYLFVEAYISVKLLRKQDKNHIVQS